MKKKKEEEEKCREAVFAAESSEVNFAGPLFSLPSVGGRRSGEALFDNVEAAGLARRGLLRLEGPTMKDRSGPRHGQKGVLKY
ncbi:hypothetical protein NL676_027371 [Syzygium grande]|nr:hypothetical protein NL676_027371 [Syzygium grande]